MSFVFAVIAFFGPKRCRCWEVTISKTRSPRFWPRDTYGTTPEQMVGAIRSFKCVEHRLESVATVGGIEFVNDSKATNVDSAVKAVESFDQNIIVILGGKDKDTSFEALVEAMTGRVRQ